MRIHYWMRFAIFGPMHMRTGFVFWKAVRGELEFDQKLKNPSASSLLLGIFQIGLQICVQ